MQTHGASTSKSGSGKCFLIVCQLMCSDLSGVSLKKPRLQESEGDMSKKEMEARRVFCDRFLDSLQDKCAFMATCFTFLLKSLFLLLVRPSSSSVVSSCSPWYPLLSFLFP